MSLSDFFLTSLVFNRQYRIMKKNKFYYLSLLLCTLALGFTSCEKEDEDDFDVSDLYGDWLAVSAEYQEYLNGELLEEDYWDESDDDEVWGVRFTKDEEWYNWEEYDGSYSFEYGGTFSCKNGKLKVYSEEDGSYTYTIKTLTSTKLVLTASETYTEDGDKYKYVETQTFEKANIQ